MANQTQEIFMAIGHSGHDIRHICVTVYPYTFDEGGVLRQGWKAYAGTKKGDIETCVPTDYIFALADNDWEFMEFEVGGKTWPGLAIFPDNGDHLVEFGDENRQSIILHNLCEQLYVHRYQLVVRNKLTGEIAVCDPDSNNGQGPGGGG